MNRVTAAGNLIISGAYLYKIAMHMIHPGMDTDYTRMLMFVFLATIPLSFMMAMIGGSDRLSALPSLVRQASARGPLSALMLAGFGFITVLMPVGMLLAVWSGMGLQIGLLFALYFIPVMLRLAFAPARDVVLAAVTRGVTLFASFGAGFVIVLFLDSFTSGTEIYEQHLQVIWPGYGDAAVLFFSVCAFTMFIQALEFRHALSALFSGPASGDSEGLKPQP